MEKTLESWFGGPIPHTQERLALLSLAYNNLIGPGKSPSLHKALIDDGNRAEAWYQIRYYSNKLAKYHLKGVAMNAEEQAAYSIGEDKGTAKRRFIESDLFGLYRDPSHVTGEEAKQAYRMLEKHREYILKYEAGYGQTPEGAVGTRGDQVAAANNDPTLNIVASPDYLVDAFSKAETALLADLRSQYADNADVVAKLTDENLLSTNIYLDPTDPVVDSTHGAILDATLYKTGTAHDRSNLLIGLGGNDQLKGDAGADVLLGGEGDDRLEGGKGNDLLKGGMGLDTYKWNTGDGSDTIIDDDKQGVIVINNGNPQDLFAVGAFVETAPGSGVWQQTMADGSVLTLTHHSPWRLVTTDGSEIILGDTWQDGDFGIHLVEEINVATTLTIEGDLKPMDFDAEQAGVQPHYDDLGNVIVSTEAEPDRDDTLYDSTGNDHLRGQGGADILDAKRGGNDVLEGGAGVDLLSGGDGDDYLYGEAQKNLADALVQALPQAPTGERGDWLDGGAGADTLVGEGGNDLMLGGGGGDDNLYGDKSGFAYRDWSVSRRVTTANDVTSYWTTFANAGTTDADVGAADVI